MKKIILSYWFFPVTVVLLICFGPIFANLGIVSGPTGFMISLSSVIFAILSIVHGAWLTWWQDNRAGFTGMYVGIGLLGYIITLFISASDTPLINDISTDLINPPPIAHVSSSYPEEFKSIMQSEYTNIQGKHIEETPKAIQEKILNLLKEDQKVSHIETKSDRQDQIIQYINTSKIFKFIDDVTIRITPKGLGCYVDMRSRSRFGRSDFGANAVRIKELLNKI